MVLPTFLAAQSATSLEFPAVDTINQVDKKGRKQGTWKKKHENGKTRYIGQFINDKPSGEFLYYDNYGTLTAKINHLTNDTAEVNFFHDGKNVMSEGKYYKMQRTGIWKFYDREGDITSQCIFVNGKKHGMSRVYYKDGHITKEEIYENGILNGVVKEFFPSGKIKFTGVYIDDNLEGKVEWFHPNGARKVRGYYKYAVREKTWTHFDSGGSPTLYEYYAKGRLKWSKTPAQVKAEKELKKQKQDSLNSSPEIKE
ncbi:MAG: hypothetical protein CL840_18005 [Crocinitomicaceae bacterium]|nr:hypothetical protein [Crocinitomicaceae bacterium]|tara:strand:+ start:26975 stop:27739 length:765 start_codon:yes stop_codon:yes gene_type:complete